MKKFTLAFMVLVSLLSHKTFAQTFNWSFNNNTLEGWTLANQLTQSSISGGIVTMNITGGDPYMVSSTNLNFSAADKKIMKIQLQNSSSDATFQLFYLTDKDKSWNQQKSLTFAVKTAQSAISTYYVDFSSSSLWKDNIYQLRLDLGTNNGGQVAIDNISFIPKTDVWNFTIDKENWLMEHSVSEAVTGGKLQLSITGSDPYIKSPADICVSAELYTSLEVSLQNFSNETQFQVFWITDKDNSWNQNKSANIAVSKADATFKTYSIDLVSNPNWKDLITQIRIDLGNGTLAPYSVYIDYVKFTKENFFLDNGIVKVGQDLFRGGAINHISANGTNRNLVNIHDEGRYIQQSYYAGNKLNRQQDGQSPSWSPWEWNPIQAGDVYKNRAQILEHKTNGVDSMYVKCVPMLWDMNNMPAEAEMEQWTYLSGNVLHIKNKITCHRTDNIYGEGVVKGQELPAVYPISALKNLYYYSGSKPFTNDTMSHPATVKLETNHFWGIYNKVNEDWMAFVNDTLWGMAVYNTNNYKFLAGMTGSVGGESMSSSTSYISPVALSSLMKNSVYEFEYQLIIGSLSEIRNSVYSLHDKGPFGNNVIFIPGKIEAEQYDKGGMGIGYLDKTLANGGNFYRTNEGVDIKQFVNSPSQYSVDSIESGEWLKYHVYVDSTSTYELSFQYSTVQPAMLHIEVDDKNVTGTIQLPSTGSINNYINHLISQKMNLTKGNHIIKVFFENDGMNLDFVEISEERNIGLKITEPESLVFDVFPNPSNGDFVLTYAGENSIAKVYDIQGNFVMQFTVKKGANQFSLDAYSNSMYILQIDDKVKTIVFQK